MRPLKLTFEGINSFETRQEIDFKRLTDAHLFGIFGPTGAGKSTILDAMTLALYGEVVRASHKTGGIMNTRCDSLLVDFVFSLGENDTMRTYRVMRQYSRERDKNEKNAQNAGLGDTLKVKKCSLRCIDGDKETVLCAEKSFEINQMIRQLLGLTMDDFVHSVVLPQGQFAEFLNMTGKDRRDMLERLFHLEAFGKRLNDRIRDREQSVSMHVSEVEAALREVGDVNENMLKEAKIKRELDKDELEKAERESSAADREAEGLRVLYDRIQERKTWQVRKLEHDAARSRISAMNIELDAARRANAVLPIATEVSELDDEIASQHRLAHESTRAFENARDYNDKVIAEADSRRPVLSEEKQQFQKRIGALETLLPRQEEMDRLNAKRSDILRQLEEIKHRIEENDRLLSDKRSALEKGKAFVAQQEKLAAECADVDIEKLNRGAQLERDMEQRQISYAEALSKLNTCTESYNQATAELETAHEREQAGLKALNEAKAAVIHAEEVYIAAREMNSAAELARHLADGKPCPVCGSVHHPIPAHKTDSIVDDREKARSIRDQKQNEYSNLVREIARLGQVREQHEQMQAELHAQVIALNTELAELTAQWEKLCHETGVSDMRQAYAAAIEKQRNAGDANLKLAKAYERLESYRRQEQEYSMEQLRLRNDAEKKNDELKENQRASSNWAGELKRLDMQVGTDIHSELDDCRSRLDHIDHQLNKIETALTDARRRLDETQHRAADQNARLEEMQRRRDEKGSKLQQMLLQNRFETVDQAKTAYRTEQCIAQMDKTLKEDEYEQRLIDTNLKRLAEIGNEREVTDAEMNAANSKADSLRQRVKELTASQGALDTQINDMSNRLNRRRELDTQAQKYRRELDSVTDLKQVLRGNALVEFVANRYLEDITRMAGERLMFLSGKRYNLELGGDGFIVRDMDKGGVLRATSTLSGGETFLVSLALALSLSLHINLRGKPLGFFFLDEGFGTLDEKLLSTVMEALTMLARDIFPSV